MSFRGMCDALIDSLGRRDVASNWEHHQDNCDMEPLMRRKIAGDWRYRAMTEEERLDWLLTRQADTLRTVASVLSRRQVDGR